MTRPPYAVTDRLPDWLRPRPTDAELVREADRKLMLLALTAATTLFAAFAAFIAIVGALALAASPARASGEFACSSVPFVNERARAALDEHAATRTMRFVLIEHAHRWDADEMIRLCRAKAAGEDVALGCLDGRRDWNAIVASVSVPVRRMNEADLYAYLQSLRAERAKQRPHQRAMNACVRMGAADGIVQPVPGSAGDASGSGD